MNTTLRRLTGLAAMALVCFPVPAHALDGLYEWCVSTYVDVDRPKPGPFESVVAAERRITCSYFSVPGDMAPPPTDAGIPAGGGGSGNDPTPRCSDLRQRIADIKVEQARIQSETSSTLNDLITASAATKDARDLEASYNEAWQRTLPNCRDAMAQLSALARAGSVAARCSQLRGQDVTDCLDRALDGTEGQRLQRVWTTACSREESARMAWHTTHSQTESMAGIEQGIRARFEALQGQLAELAVQLRKARRALKNCQ